LAQSAKKRNTGSARSKPAQSRTGKSGRVINRRHTLARKTPARGEKSGGPVVLHLSRAMCEVLGISAIAIALIMLLALLTFNSNDPGWSHTGTGVRIENSIGRAGAWFADVFFYLLGYMAYLLPVILGVYGWTLFRDKSLSDDDYQPFAFVRIIGFVLMLAAAAGLADLHFGVAEGALPHGTFGGGVIGTATAWKLVAILKPLGTTLVLLPLFFGSLTLAIGTSWLQVIETMGGWVQMAFARLTAGFDHWREVQAETKKRKSASAVREVTAKRRKTLLSRRKNRLDDNEKDPLMDAPGELAAAASVAGKAPSMPPPSPRSGKKLSISARAKEEKQFSLFRDVPDSELPPLSLLDPPTQQKPGFSDADLENLSRLLETKLLDFNITVEVVAVHPGPVITRFELQPSPGVKARQITNLTQDIARSLSIVSVRVVEVIKGKSTIGLEIPNEEREIVQLSEMLQSEQYDAGKSPLTLALGKNISGVPVTADLQRMPHLLVAGTTGSGKSVAVNAMLVSLLYKATPREVRLILIDPKMLELNIYDGIPHLLTPVVTDMKEASNALRWCVGEMERRYKLMASLGVRNLAGFNKKIREAEARGEPLVDPLYKAEESMNPTAPPSTLEPLPYIVVVVDEFADMMMQVGKKAEELIARIAQKARAAGIHLILATQRPSVDVITGLIKANIPTRIAFQVSSRIDSRTILDQMGAESLLGHGDMLYLPPGTALPERVHGAFVDDHEVHNVAAYWKKSGEPNYIEEIVHESGPIPGLPGDKPADGSETDALYDQAIAVVTESRKASISYVQRRLKIGYNRAARMIEDMESAGVVSQVQSNGTREVLAPPPVSV